MYIGLSFLELKALIACFIFFASFDSELVKQFEQMENLLIMTLYF